MGRNFGLTHVLDRQAEAVPLEPMARRIIALVSLLAILLVILSTLAGWV